MFDALVIGYRVVFLQLAAALGAGWAIVALSFICSALMTPLMKAVAGVVKREKEYEDIILPQVEAINKAYSSGRERNLHVRRLYARYAYSPLCAVKTVLPLFVQIPFLFLTYAMLKGTAEINGVPFLFLADLGRPDALLAVSSLRVNLLPILMTAINVVTVFATPGFTRRDWTQAIGVSLLFLALLYTAPSALLLYWTLNNAISLFKALLPDRLAGLRLLGSRLAHLVRGIHPLSRMKKAVRPVLSWKAPFLVFRNFLVLLPCAFLPAMILIFGHMPDRLDMEIESEKPLSLKVGFLEKDDDGNDVLAGVIVQGCPLGRHVDPVSFFLSDGCDAATLRIQLKGADYDYKVSSLTLIRHLLFRYELPYVIEENVIRCSSAPVFRGFTFPVVRGSLMALKAGLAGLVLLAVLGLFVTKERAVEWRLSFAMAAIGAAFFAALLPLQTVMANRDAFDFPLFTVLAQVGTVDLVVFALLFAVLAASSAVYGRWPHLLFFGLLLYEYLQTGVLSHDAPPMDGNMDYYWKTAPLLRDCAAMALVGILLLWKASWLRSHFRQICLGSVFVLSISAVVMVADGLKAAEPAEASEARKTCPWSLSRSQVVKELKYSPSGNVIVIVLDSTQSDAAYHVMRKDANLRRAFTGFTAFNNHVGMHDNTMTGTVGLFTGTYREKGVSRAGWEALCYGEDSFVTPYVDAGNPVYVLPGILGAYSNRVEPKPSDRRGLSSDSVFLCRKKPMNTNLLDVLQLRLVPFFLKKWDLQIMYLGTVVSDGTFEEHSLYPELANCGVGDETKPALIYLHTEGTHAPIRYDEFGNRIWTNKNNYRGLCGETHYILKSVAAFMRDLAKRGVYDDSLIVITADHGCCFSTPQLPKLSEAPTRAVPMLWIKPVGAGGDMTTTEIPTSHAKVCELVRRARTEALTMADVKRILHSPVRRFIEDGADFREWRFDENGKRIGE